MNRRELVKGAALLPLMQTVAKVGNAQDHLWQGYGFAAPFASSQRLDQGPFNIEQDDGWATIFSTTASEQPLRNPGLGLLGYTWEESGPSVAAREGRETLEQHVERLASLPFVDVLYIRCDWRNVQKRAGRLDLDPVWELTLDAARRHGLRVAFRVQSSNTVYQPKQYALPDFLRERVPMVSVGQMGAGSDTDSSLSSGAKDQWMEPRYDHPEYLKALAELNGLLAERFDGNPLVEFVDLMHLGFWGEGHFGGYANPFPDRATAQRTLDRMVDMQLGIWKHTPLAMNTQPDISNTGNGEAIERAVRGGAWLRSDSILIEEPIQIEQLANRPPWLAAVLEDGYFRTYDAAKLEQDKAGVNALESYMLHVLDVRANYWSLWTESANLAAYNERYPRGFDRLRKSIGYRIRPSWVWQRKRYGTNEVVIAVSNRGVSGVPGVLWLTVRSADGRVQLRGSLDPGHPYGGGLRLAAFVLPKGFTGTIHLGAELEMRPGVFRAVRWACEQPCDADGTIAIEVRQYPIWRKSI